MAGVDLLSEWSKHAPPAPAAASKRGVTLGLAVSPISVKVLRDVQNFETFRGRLSSSSRLFSIEIGCPSPNPQSTSKHTLYTRLAAVLCQPTVSVVLCWVMQNLLNLRHNLTSVRTNRQQTIGFRIPASGTDSPAARHGAGGSPTWGAGRIDYEDTMVAISCFAQLNSKEDRHKAFTSTGRQELRKDP